MNKNKKQTKTKRCSYADVPLAKFRPIIEEYWESFDKVLEEYKSDTMSVSQIDPRTIQLILNLKKIEVWKANIFILYLYFQKTRLLAEALNIKEASLSVYLSKIKKENR